MDTNYLLTEMPWAFRYQLLARMQNDCKYYLGYGDSQVKHLWAMTEEDQIAFMLVLFYGLLSEAKPEWISADEILTYADRMHVDKTAAQNKADMILKSALKGEAA
jgi:hypothetical protein